MMSADWPAEGAAAAAAPGDVDVAAPVVVVEVEVAMALAAVEMLRCLRVEVSRFENCSSPEP